jgi:cathepsin H
MSYYKNSNADRKDVFSKKVMEVIRHNANPNAKYQKGINSYSDMTDEEFNSYFNIVSDPQACSATNQNMKVDKKFALQDIPTHFDWRDVGAVTPVKNQAKCGSCWTFSTVGCMESHYMIKYGQFRNLSEQQLVDCAGDYDNHGCKGGLPSHAFQYIIDAGGLATEVSYPYTAVDGTCTFTKDIASVTVVGGSVNITVGDETEMLHAIFEHGPVSIAYQVVDGFRDYKTGVYHSDVCKNTAMDVNHAVLAVGFGNEDGMDYWIVKNSWGTAWGDNGFFKIQRGVNMCGISNCNAYPADVASVSKSTEEQEFKQIIQ